MGLFFSPQSWPFLLALLFLLAIAITEGLALLIGFSLSGWLDHAFPDLTHEVNLEASSESWLGWLHIGKVPLLVVVTVFLTAFAVLGFCINGLAYALFGIYPSAFISVPLAFLGSLPIVRLCSAGLARLILRDETSAEPLDKLVGRTAIIINGTAKLNYPAQARVKNEHGQTLYVHVEPDDESIQLEEGESVLLVKQLSGARFQAIANPRPDFL